MGERDSSELRMNRSMCGRKGDREGLERLVYIRRSVVELIGSQESGGSDEGGCTGLEGQSLWCLRDTVKPKECVGIWYYTPITLHVLTCL